MPPRYAEKARRIYLPRRSPKNTNDTKKDTYFVFFVPFVVEFEIHVVAEPYVNV
jgi:hypothetical protein